MIKIYLVAIESGWAGFKCFRKKENAEKYMDMLSKNTTYRPATTLSEELATPKEYHDIIFED